MLRVRCLLAHAMVRCFATSAPKVYTATDVMGWNVSRVVEFAKSDVGLDEDDAKVLVENKIVGKDLLHMTEDKLVRANMPLGPATRLATAIAKLPRLPEETVTLTFKSKGGNPFPVKFTPSRFEAYVLSGRRTIFHMTKGGSRKGEVLTLDEAMSVVAPDYLLLATPFDTMADLDGFTRHHASGLEQQTTRSIAKNPEFLKDYGVLTALADGNSVTFYAADKSKLLEADGLVKSSVCLLLNEARHSPDDDDVLSLDTRTKMLRELLADPARVRRTSPPGIMDELAGITKVVPVLCGFHFAPSVAALCRQHGITPITTEFVTPVNAGT